MKEWLKLFGTLVAVMFLVLAPVVTLLIGMCLNNQYWERITVDRGYAEYLTAENGKQVWQWKQQPQPKAP